MVLGYFLWGAAVMMTILKANKDGKQNQGSSQDLSKSNRLGIVVFGAFCWPWFIYDLMKDAAELEEKTEGENQ
ncbi:hypothetical protein SAMN05443574_12429 [Haloarcula vallismortis]|nr:hypothetical protein SAMN05443574_12429 [Haloarcula vallismortis]